MQDINYLKERWKIAIAGIIIQILLGTVYGWSVFKCPLIAKHGWSGTECSMAFTLAILLIGVSAALGGRFAASFEPNRNVKLRNIRVWR